MHHSTLVRNPAARSMGQMCLFCCG